MNKMTEPSALGFVWDADKIVEDLIRKADETVMPLPSIETEPHLLISKVRKHYLEYIIKLLSLNYENYQMLLNKNIHLPSAIWRCAKNLEANAARASMLVKLYRKNIVAMVKELKNDTNRGKLHKRLYDCLQGPLDSEKKTQTTFKLSSACTCQCTCNGRIKRRRSSTSPKNGLYKKQVSDLNTTTKDVTPIEEQYKIPIVLNTQVEPPQVVPFKPTNNTDLQPVQPNKLTQGVRMSVESHDSGEDQIMLQLEQLFRADSNDDDLFEGTFNILNTPNCETQDSCNAMDTQEPIKNTCNNISDEQANKIKSLDERLALLESSGALPVNQVIKTDTLKPKKHFQTKWLCEAYFQKVKLFEKLDEIRDYDRKKHTQIKNKFIELFGEDSDGEQVMSPLEETPEFVLSCKERVAPWIVRVLTPHYVKGRIRGKALFKLVAKHLIKLIYQCSRYPSEYEVHSFVTDFLKNHPLIRCEADFRHFRINNI